MEDSLPRLAEALKDRYRLERELGAGGMATVYLAEDVKHHRQVAIKVLKPELATTRLVRSRRPGVRHRGDRAPVRPRFGLTYDIQ